MQTMTTATPQQTQLRPLRVAAHRFGVPLKWLIAQVEAGRVPALKAGARYVCDIGAVEAALLRMAQGEQVLPPLAGT